MSTSVKTRKMTSTKGSGSESKKGTSHKSSPKMTKYLQNLGVSKTPTPTTGPETRQSAMPTPTRSSQNKEHQQREQVCENIDREESESESDIGSVNTDDMIDNENVENWFKLPYSNIKELEKECIDEIDPREITLTPDALPVILLSLLRSIEGVQSDNSELEKENNTLKGEIDGNEKMLTAHEMEIKQLTADIIRMKESHNDYEKDNNNLKISLDFAYAKIATLEIREKERTEEEKQVKKNIETIKIDNTKLKEDNTKMKEKNVKAEAYSRRSNLRFEGIPTIPNETNVQSRNKVYDFLKNNLGMEDAERNIVIERCHRDAKYQNQNPPSIIARFLSFNDRQAIWENRNRVNKNKNNKLFINEDFPQEVERKRSFLRPYVKASYNNNMRATLIGDTLLVEGNKYTVDTLHTLPEKIRPEKTVVRTDGETTVFFRKDAYLSNFYPSTFTIKDVKYSSVEQYSMAAKADKFDDQEAKQKIMTSNNPNEINFVGRSVKNFNQNKWNETAHGVMKVAVTAKFNQNPLLAELLNNTGETTIGEGSGKDLFWGTGIPVFHPDALNTTKWKGKKHLGRILMEVRKALKE